MLQKYLQRRGKLYYFRWRIPAEMRELFGVTELKQSLFTTDILQASVRSRQFIEVVIEIQKLKQSYAINLIELQEYTEQLKTHWLHLCSLTKREQKAETIGRVKDSLSSPSNSNITFSQLFDEFITHKTDLAAARREGRRPLAERAVKEYQRYIKTLLEIIPDYPVVSFDRNIVKDVLMTYKQLPQRNKKPYCGLSVSELLEMEIPEQDNVSNKTVEAVRKLLQGIFRYAIDANYIDTSPARDLNLKLSVSTTFAQYTKSEIISMLNAASKEKKEWHFWLPFLAAYTGARRSELIQIRKQDIRFDDDSNRYYILITDEAGSVKTENAVRQVPIHKTLIEKGFIEFVNVSGDRLFDIKPQAVTAWFARFRTRLGINGFDDFGNRKVFHSFRHTFITLSRGAGNSLECVQQVVGHEKTNAGITDRYSHRLPIGDVLDVVDKVNYS